MSEKNRKKKKKNLHKIKAISFLRQNGYKKLSRKYDIKIKEHNEYSNLKQLSYSQLTSPFSSSLVCECRNLIVDSQNNFKCVCWGFEKFFNYGERHAAKLDYSSIKVYEKVDGSIICMYRYNGQWFVSSSTLPNANGNVHGHKSKTMSELFWEIWCKLGYNLPKGLDLIYIFELFSPQNIILVRPDTDRIILLGVRNMKTLKELQPEGIAKENGWECAKTHDDLHSLSDVVERSKILDPMKHEGFVIVDKNFKRVKVKCPSYVALSGLSKKTTQSAKISNRRKLLTVILTNEEEEFLSYFQHIKMEYAALKEKVHRLFSFLEKMRKDSLNYEEFYHVFPEEVKEKLIKVLYNSKKTILKTIQKEPRTHTQNVEILLDSLKINVVENPEGINKDEQEEDLKDLLKSVIPEESVEPYVVLSQLTKMFMHRFSILKKENFKLEFFGSFASKTNFKGSDYDISIVSNEKLRIDDIEEMLLENEMRNVNPVFTARFPVIKFTYPEGDLEIDLSFDHYGVKKSRLIKEYVEISPLCREIILLTKLYAKKRCIIDPKKRFLNSFAISLMVIFFFQTKGILPVLLIDEGGVKKVEKEKSDVGEEKISEKVVGEEKISEKVVLKKFLVEMFDYYSNFDWDSNCISVRRGGIIKIVESKLAPKTPKVLCVEDPFEVYENAGRTVSLKSREIILFEFQRFGELVRKNKKIVEIMSVPKIKKRKRKKKNSNKKRK